MTVGQTTDWKDSNATGATMTLDAINIRVVEGMTVRRADPIITARHKSKIVMDSALTADVAQSQASSPSVT